MNASQVKNMKMANQLKLQYLNLYNSVNINSMFFIAIYAATGGMGGYLCLI